MHSVTLFKLDLFSCRLVVKKQSQKKQHTSTPLHPSHTLPYILSLYLIYIIPLDIGFVVLPIPNFFSISLCTSGGGTSESSGRPKKDSKPKSSNLPDKTSIPNLEEGKPGRSILFSICSSISIFIGRALP